MSFLGKVYTYQKHENYDGWLRTVGVTEDKAAQIVDEKRTQKFVKDGDSYVLTQTNPKGEKVTTFKPGVEFDDTIGNDDVRIKSTYTIDGNTVTQVFTGPYGACTFRREFDGDDLVMYITGERYNGVAKRIYKA